MSLAQITCGKCGMKLFEDENLKHDGYMGSSHAHNGRGSYGLGRHHYFYSCPNCGWREGETAEQTESRQRSQRARHAAKCRGNEVLPAGCNGDGDTVVLSCDSRMTKVENLALEIAREQGRVGGVTHHSLRASYRYNIVPKQIFETAAGLIKQGIGGLNWWAKLKADHRMEVYNRD